eukprot:980901-Amphidinium_carterae.1
MKSDGLNNDGSYDHLNIRQPCSQQELHGRTAAISPPPRRNRAVALSVRSCRWELIPVAITCAKRTTPQMASNTASRHRRTPDAMPFGKCRASSQINFGMHCTTFADALKMRCPSSFKLAAMLL